MNKPPQVRGAASSRPLGSRLHRDYSPVAWTEYFDEAHDVTLGAESDDEPIDNLEQDSETTKQADNSFRVYMKNFQKPYAPERQLGRRLDSKRVECTESEFNEYCKVPTLVLLHGGGYSGLTWAQFAKQIEQHCQCRILSIDLRAHGDTKTAQDDQMDIDTLVKDVSQVAHAVHQQVAGFLDTPKLVLVGHSMGGAIALKCASRCTELMPSLAGFVIIDVVEGTAKDALPLMMSVIKTRPTRFPNLSNAIEWCVRSGMGKNSEAARVSMPGNLVNLANGRLAIHDVEPPPVSSGKNRRELMKLLKQHKFSISIDQLIGQSRPAAIVAPHRLPLPPRIAALGGAASTPTSGQPVISEAQEDEDDDADESVENNEKKTDCRGVVSDVDDSGYKRPPDVDKITGYGWRTNLAKTQPFWNGWFDGLSAELLAAPVQGKFLLLAGIDRLDKTLTIGQMQGKFMMKVLPKCGHAVHEDVPEQVALAIGDFLVRNKFAAPNADL